MKTKKMYECTANGKRSYFVIASSAKKAKHYYKKASRCCCEAKQVKCVVADIDVDEEEIEGVVYPGSELALAYGVEYEKQEQRI